MSWKLQGVDAAILGFDAREMSMDSGTSWDEARRGTYLLQTDVRKPLSVDPAVWPSLFEPGRTLPLPDWTGPNQNLWDDLPRMQRALGPSRSEPHWAIAISWVSADGFTLPPESTGPYREEMIPSTPAENWMLLGFDIADAGLISGLSNCGYDPATGAELRASWAAHLNEHHLFTEVDKAFAFRALTDRRVPEHAPFFIYALSWIPGGPA